MRRRGARRGQAAARSALIIPGKPGMRPEMVVLLRSGLLGGEQLWKTASSGGILCRYRWRRRSDLLLVALLCRSQASDRNYAASSCSHLHRFMPKWCYEAASMEIFGSSSSTALHRRSFAVKLLILTAQGRPLQAMLLAFCWHLLFFFLPAGEPKGRIFASCVAAFIAWSSPSGAIPGDGAGGCDGELNISGGGVGPDCLFNLSLKVLFVKVNGSVAVYLSARVIDVNCNPTAYV